MQACVRRSTQPQHQQQHAAFLVLQNEREIGREGGFFGTSNACANILRARTEPCLLLSFSFCSCTEDVCWQRKLLGTQHHVVPNMRPTATRSCRHARRMLCSRKKKEEKQILEQGLNLSRS